MKNYLLMALFFSAMAGQAARAAPAPALGQVITLANGANMIAVDGMKVLATLAHRENYNAHSFDIFSLMINEAVASGDATTWNAVTFFDGDKERYALTSSGGADCLLHDFRLLGQGKSLSLVLADRDLGDSFADKARVVFSFYALRKNTQGDIGRPLYYFERTSTKPARKAYCDVGEGFEQELHLPGRN